MLFDLGNHIEPEPSREQGIGLELSQKPAWSETARVMVEGAGGCA